MKIQRYEEHTFYDNLATDFINNFEKKINESDEDVDCYKDVQRKVLSDLKLNSKLSFTFGAGIGAFYPIVEELMKNMSISSIELTPNCIVLLTVCAITIVYLEEKKPETVAEEERLTKDSKSMLEELRMMGIGNGIVKKLVKVLKSIISIFKMIGDHKSAVVRGFMDMFAYTTILIPILNGIHFIIGKYDLTLDSFLENFVGLSMGIATLIAKHGIKYIVRGLKDRLNISDEEEKDIVTELDASTIKKISDFRDDVDGESINEQ
jgi:hypothetical protein